MNRLVTVAVLVLASALLHAEEVKHSADSAETVRKSVDEGKAVLVDVREQSEWDILHVKGAVHIPLSSVKADPKKAAASLPKDKPVYIHCAVGGRALRCAQEWKALGYDVRPLELSVSHFGKAGFEVQSEQKPSSDAKSEAK